MKLSAFLASLCPLDPQSDPDLLILLDSGELAPLQPLDPAHLDPDDPVVLEILTLSAPAIILTAE